MVSRILVRKMLRDLFARKLALAALLAIVAVGVGSFTAMRALHRDLDGARARYYGDYRLFDFVVDLKRAPAWAAARAAHLPNVRVEPYSGLTVNFARQMDAQVMVRGLRMSSDFEREFEMALMNKKLEQDVEVICLMTCLEFQFLSSSLLKEACQLGGDISSLVPEHVAAALREKFSLAQE